VQIELPIVASLPRAEWLRSPTHALPALVRTCMAMKRVLYRRSINF
jgi:hypothetical protein